MCAMLFNRNILAAILSVGFVMCACAEMGSPSLGQFDGGARYATDAYPGFDSGDDVTKPARKEPRWFSFVTGPSCETAAETFAFAQELLTGERWAKACRQLDALVRKWPTAGEAAKAQQLLAETLLDRLGETEDAFKEFRYLLDFYSLQCDYGAIADKLYELAGRLKTEGKEVMFIRFANTVDVRHAYEACVLRAPGARWVPAAMLTIASLREADGKYKEAIKVYENLRNLHPSADEAKIALLREASVRMTVLREHAYNRARCRDTLDFMKLALRSCRAEDAAAIKAFADEAQGMLADEAYRSAKFYDSATRTKRSAVNAYERFLAEFPESGHADEVRARVAVLKGEGR